MEREIQAGNRDPQRVLVIDDDTLMRELLSVLLSAQGHSVSTAESGDIALEKLAGVAEGKLPTVLLTDLKMPGVSHAALGLALRVVCPPPAVVVAMSASAASQEELTVFDAFLRKPFSVEEYAAAVDRAQQRVKQRAAAVSLEGQSKAARPGRGLRRVGAAPDEDDADSRALNFSVFDKLAAVMGLAELPPLYAMFMDDVAARTAHMVAATAVNDAVTFVREAHAIKGGCGMLGATELYSFARSMEQGGLACSSLTANIPAALERLRRILEERAGKHAGPTQP